MIYRMSKIPKDLFPYYEHHHGLVINILVNKSDLLFIVIWGGSARIIWFWTEYSPQTIIY